jgi:DNA topoisomerase-1
MSDAKIDRTVVTVSLSNSSDNLIARGEIITFEGFMKVYLEGKDDEVQSEKGVLPTLKIGEILDLKDGLASEQFSRHPARYTEASLVKKMEELGIGRPSTYAATITTVQKRGYVEKDTRDGYERISKVIELKNKQLEAKKISSVTGAEKNKLFPTDIGIVVTDFLIDNFSDVMQYSFTASVENEFDEIAEGKKFGMK